MSKRIVAKAGTQQYDIVIGQPLSQLVTTFSRLAGRGVRVALISDVAVARHYGQPLQRKLAHAGYDVYLLSIPSGESSKVLRQAERLYRFCAQARLERTSWLIALGGGVVGDLSGFVAGTYLRGLSYIQVPTTLLAQVDSSIGGKTGVDVPEGKNLVGLFNHPRLIWSDPQVLRTLPKAHWRNGLAEVIKYGAIQDANLFATLEKKMDVLLKGYSPAWVPIIGRCAEIKASVVERDPRETLGLRAILNFGHSVGHSIEAATDYSGYLHGEAISIGMFVAAIVSQQQGLMEAVDRIRLGTLLTRAGLPLRVRKPIPRARFMEHLARDKKSSEGAVRFVLLERIGKARSGQMVSPGVLDMALSTVGL